LLKVLAAKFFSRAARQEQSSHKGRLLDAIARRFERWRRRHGQLSRDLRNQPNLLAAQVPLSKKQKGTGFHSWSPSDCT
jgi:hypothetical protein